MKTRAKSINPPLSQQLRSTVVALLADNKGILAIDESNATCNTRFAKFGIQQTAEFRRDWRELIISTPNLAEAISGVILYNETARQNTDDGRPFLRAVADAGLLPGIKVDIGAKVMAGHQNETITEGLDGLRDRLAEYALLGVRFAKWRAVIGIGEQSPSRACIEANAHALARYASLCQEAGLVPIIEPEVLMDGAHTQARSGDVTTEVLHTLFQQLYTQRVALDSLILKPNMVLPGLACLIQVSADEVAEATIACCRQTVPAAVSGIAFLSGGQSGPQASARLNAMNARFKALSPWALSFSFARAIQEPALEIWAGQAVNVPAAQKAIYHRASCNRAARSGQYDQAMEAQ